MYKKYTLKNGLRLILVSRPRNLAATVLVLVKAGSEYEEKKNNGISHFLEHMVFKGTSRRPRPGDISKELEALGAEYNAFTGRQWTMYYAKSEKGNLPKILDLVADLYLDPLLDPAEIEKEKGVIVEEINLYEDTPSRRVQENFVRLLHGDQPAGWDIAGDKERVRKFGRGDFASYRSRHYVPSGTVVVVSGAFSALAVKRQVGELFGRVPAGISPRKPKTKEQQTSPRMHLQYKNTKQSHLVLGFRAFSIFDPRRYALRVLGEILGGGMSSRLFARVREEMGAAYYIHAGEDLSSDHGHFAVSAGTEIGKAEFALRAILEEIGRIKKRSVSKEELNKAKGHMVGGLVLGLETSDDLAGFYGAQEISSNRIIEVEEIVRKIRKVSAEDVRRVARAVFREGGMNLALIGPHRDEAGFRKLLKLPD